MTIVRFFLGLLLVSLPMGLGIRAQESGASTFRVKVDMVVVSFTVTDSKGKYINGLKPGDFKVFEDEIQENIASFSEGNRAPIDSESGTAPKTVAATASGPTLSAPSVLT